MIWKDYDVTVNDVDLSSSTRAVAFNIGQQAQEQGAAGDDWEHFEPGVQTGRVTAQFWQDFSSGGVDDTLFALADGGGTFSVVLVPTSSAVAAGNPSFTATCMVENYEPFAGQWSDKAICSVDFVPAAGTGWARSKT